MSAIVENGNPSSVLLKDFKNIFDGCTGVSDHFDQAIVFMSAQGPDDILPFAIDHGQILVPVICEGEKDSW